MKEAPNAFPQQAMAGHDWAAQKLNVAPRDAQLSCLKQPGF